MKNVKRFLGILLIMALVMSLSVSAFAASIKINSTAESGEAATDTTVYTYYKILDAEIENAHDISVDVGTGDATTAGEEPAVSYYVTTQVKATAIEGTGLFTVTKDATQDKWYIALKDEDTSADEIATAFFNIKNSFVDASGTFAQTEVGGTATADGLAPGYYLITSTLGDELVVQTLADVTINTKNDYPTVEKEVADEDKSAQIGDVINYTLTVVIPESATNQIVLTDTMTVGLTFEDVNSVTPSGDGAAPLTVGTDYIVSSTTTDTDGSSFTITFPATTIVANKGKTLTIDYTAILNKNAVVATSASDTDGNDNTVVLAYGENYTSVPKTVETDTQMFTFDKIDDFNNVVTKLPGAVFELQLNGTALKLYEVAAGETYRIASADEITAGTNIVTQITTTGKIITVNGVDGDVTYDLVEIEPPTGYNMPDEPITKVTPTTDNKLAPIIENNKGTVLPSTGGIGTTIFYVIGGLLVVGAGVVLVSRRKSQDD